MQETLDIKSQSDARLAACHRISTARQTRHLLLTSEGGNPNSDSVQLHPRHVFVKPSIGSSPTIPSREQRVRTIRCCHGAAGSSGVGGYSACFALR